jgi:Na+/melibiose symporter-like transporter
MAVGNSACYQSAFAMLADTIEEDRKRTGEAKGGLYSALWVINDKIGFAIGGTLIAGLVLQAFGFQQGQGATQTPEALTGIVVAYAVLPAVLNLSAIALMWIGYKPAPAAAPQPQPAE